jgi:hypothetical protein
VPAVSVKELHTRLGFPEQLNFPDSSLSKRLIEWKMEIDDAPIFRYIYRNFRPCRHLEFGTLMGTGVLYCLEECDATVWTMNILEGEKKPDGSRVYGEGFLYKYYDYLPPWTKKMPLWMKKKIYGDDKNFGHSYQTDTIGQIGRYYLEKGFGNRVCQIYGYSRQWETSNYHDGFFDSALIDGGHSEDVVKNDTQKALKLLRSEGMIMWHDFCQQEEVFRKFETVEGVMNAIRTNWDWIYAEVSDIFWVNPSWILIGIKK